MAVMYETHPPWDPEGKCTYRTVQVGGQVHIYSSVMHHCMAAVSRVLFYSCSSTMRIMRLMFCGK